MREALEQIRMHLWMVLHHRWSALLGAVLIAALGWSGMALIKDQYEVRARLYIDSQSMLKPLLEGLAVDDQVRQQSAAIIQRTLLTREGIEKIIESTDLRKVKQDPKKLEKTIRWLSTTIMFETAGVSMNARDDRTISNIYSLSFRDEDPVLAKQVVDAALALFLDRVKSSTERDSEVAQNFIDSQIVEYKAKLEQAENDLKDFKIKHPGLVPEPGTKGFADRLQDAQLELEQARVALRENEFRAEALRRQVASSQVALAAGGNVVAPGVVETPEMTRVRALQAKLVELRATYTEQHPEVIQTQRLLDDAQKQLAAGGSARTAGGMPMAPNVEAGLIPMKMLLGQAEADTAALRIRVSEAEAKLAAMKPLSESVPQVQAELAKLTRDYNITKDTYEKLVQRRAQAELGTAGESAQMKVIEEPRVPIIPVAPNRQLLTSGVLLAAIAIGAALAWIRAQSSATFYSRRQLVSFSDVPVLGTVGMDWTAVELAKRRMGLLLFFAASALLLVVYGWQLAKAGFDFKPLLVGIQSITQGMSK